MQEAQPIPAQVAPDQNALALAELNDIIARANAVQVTNADEYAVAVAVCQNVAGQLKRRKEDQLAITRKIDAAADSVRAFFNTTFADPLQRVDKIIRGKLKAYDAEQQRIAEQKRREAEEKAEAERQAAARKAREEQEKADAQAKAQREEAERKRRQQEDAEKLAREERERQERAEREAAEAKRRGDQEAARKAQEAAADAARTARAATAIATAAATAAVRAETRADEIADRGEQRASAHLARAASIVAPLVIADQPKVKGNVRRVVWKWKITDPNKVDRRFLMPDESKIDKQVKALHKEAADLIGGIEVWDEPDLSIRGAK